MVWDLKLGIQAISNSPILMVVLGTRIKWDLFMSTENYWVLLGFVRRDSRQLLYGRWSFPYFMGMRAQHHRVLSGATALLSGGGVGSANVPHLPECANLDCRPALNTNLSLCTSGESSCDQAVIIVWEVTWDKIIKFWELKLLKRYIELMSECCESE